ncbi:endo-1,4-beta-xylanase [Hymenobacter sediminicola]|uniref:Beta-xylanase n=1 Tax=Hymenobacter sediminicola TaxID=2761579 RepID=A0A7G7W7W9_9BACT|nr:endo-1,4-beta-xylanase [Hymenobacter sediminicola]QNH62462.1 endo-1,4-beta-xylanase [Hymenobacter sediminicola]
MKAAILLSACCLTLLTQCGKKEAGSTAPEPPQPVASLKSVAPFPVGAAVNINLLKNRLAYRQVMTTEYNSITAENAMKFGALHPSATTYNWTDADYLVDFAQQNGMRVHGHTLLWYNSLPSWVTNFQGDSAAWENLMRTHIQTVVTRYRGKVASWDVVNEAIDDAGNLRNSVWRQHLGDRYIDRAFQYAAAADPAALLFYNDYGNEYSTTRRTGILNLVNTLKNRGVPIHGIGLQMHTSSNISDSRIAEAITTAAATGLKVHVAELDISMNPSRTATAIFTDALAAAQKVKYKALTQTFKALPAAQRYGITTWNVADADTWKRGDCSCPEWPLPFDDNYQRKPAYDGIVEGLQ